jgi:hypothetical protein
MSGTVDALQAVLAGEHAAVYQYGVLGGRASSSGLLVRLRTAYDAHASLRDSLAERLRELGATPAKPAVAYAIGSGWHTDAALAAAAASLEERCCAAYVVQVGAVGGDDRRLLATALVEAAVRSTGFGAPAAAFPGLRL